MKKDNLPHDFGGSRVRGDTTRILHRTNRPRKPHRSELQLDAWLIEPLSVDARRAIERLSRAPNVKRIAIMPDVHLAEGVCVGNVVATTHLIYPQAVGGDIGCGMTAVALDISPADVRRETNARALLAALPRIVPAMRWPSLASAPKSSTIDEPKHERQASDAFAPSTTHMSATNDDSQPVSNLARILHPRLLTASTLRREAARLGRIEFGTLGRGNHFLELQEDESGACWAMVHSGSRHMGQAITRFHMQNAVATNGGLQYLDAETDAGRSYLLDANWAENYARANRMQMLTSLEEWMLHEWNVQFCWDTLINCSHNHVHREQHGDSEYWVNRKGAMPAHTGQLGIIPGSMGTMSVHVSGRGDLRSLCSSAHGAGRALSRDAARRRISEVELRKQMANVWFDEGLVAQLRDEAPTAYKDIRDVLRAQRDLVRIARRLYPILVYKGV